MRLIVHLNALNAILSQSPRVSSKATKSKPSGACRDSRHPQRHAVMSSGTKVMAGLKAQCFFFISRSGSSKPWDSQLVLYVIWTSSTYEDRPAFPAQCKHDVGRAYRLAPADFGECAGVLEDLREGRQRCTLVRSIGSHTHPRGTSSSHSAPRRRCWQRYA